MSRTELRILKGLLDKLVCEEIEAKNKPDDDLCDALDLLLGYVYEKIGDTE